MADKRPVSLTALFGVIEKIQDKITLFFNIRILNLPTFLGSWSLFWEAITTNYLQGKIQLSSSIWGSPGRNRPSL